MFPLQLLHKKTVKLKRVKVLQGPIFGLGSQILGEILKSLSRKLEKYHFFIIKFMGKKDFRGVPRKIERDSIFCARKNAGAM